MTPAISQWDAAEGKARGPDRPEMPEHFSQHRGGGNPAVRRKGREMIEQTALAGGIAFRKDGRHTFDDVAETAHEVSAPVEAWMTLSRPSRRAVPGATMSRALSIRGS